MQAQEASLAPIPVSQKDSLADLTGQVRDSREAKRLERAASEKNQEAQEREMQAEKQKWEAKKAVQEEVHLRLLELENKNLEALEQKWVAEAQERGKKREYELKSLEMQDRSLNRDHTTGTR